MSEQIKAPFNPGQVDSLNAYQQSGVMHPFTCGTPSCRGLLHASREGWRCPTCRSYIQTWAWDWMADWSWLKTRDALRAP